MKKFLIFIYIVCFATMAVYSQDCSDVTATATVTASTCQSNGSITITFSGASAGNLVSQQYSLKSTTGSLSIGPVSTNVFSNLPPGTYNLEAAGYCGSISGEPIVRTINGVVVTGSYEEPRLSFVAPGPTPSTTVPTSRKSYTGCNTGLIVVLLENGNQADMPTFTVTSAPNGVTVPQTVGATKGTSGSATAGWRYMLDETWPAGTYTVVANDGCYSAAATFVIEELTTVPPGSSSASSFLTYGDGTDCSKFVYQPYYYYTMAAYPDWYRYYSDGMFEYGIAPVGQMPKDENWFQIRYFNGSSATYQDVFDISNNKVSDFYTSNSLTVYTRVKGCPTSMASYNTYNQNSTAMTYTQNTCTGVRTYRPNYIKSSYGYYHTFCYPLTITITNKSDGSVVYNNDNYVYTDANFTWDCAPGDDQYLNVTDASGYKIQTNYSMVGGTPSSSKPTFYLNTVSSYPEYNNCDSYKRSYYTGSGTPCDDESAFPCYVTVTDNVGTVVLQDTLTSTATKIIDNLQYGVLYTFTAVYPNWDNYTLTTTSNLVRATYIADSFTLTKSGISACKENAGTLRVSTGNSNKCYKAGTVITITGPDGYTSQTYTYTSNTVTTSTGYYRDFAETDLPPGEYTATVLFCGQTYTTTANIIGGYTADKPTYTTTKDCMGTQLYPSGGISNNGNPLATVYYRMMSAPSGSSASSKVISSTSGDYFLLNTAGTYILGVMTTNSLTGCAIKTDTIVYNPQPMALDRDKTSAYSCPSGQTGYLTLMATNGVAPYTYTVYDESNTTQLTPPMTSESAIDLGDFGVANETYTVRITDNCGNSFDQQVTLVSLDRTALAYGQSPVCYGSPITVNGFTVTNANYTWTGPNGFTSDQKNPVVPNATEVNEGWYKVEIASTSCGITVKDSIYISVYDPINIADLDGVMQEVTFCPYQAIIAGQAATGGSGSFTYQWAYNTNAAGTGTWSNLSGETNPTFKTTSTTYMFTSTAASPSRRYLRLMVTDATCGTFYLYYHTNVRACTFLVNPDLKNPGGPKTED
ncbi:hypothetical protein [Dysgonomonas macrotermitis]|uniref:SprB repeat-containing protein n=1 Tax=Dysgonomonas macrotermitis TaxID=1346286 RepID=A0A1M4TVJ0_9BACT|nr:hypothetical protein [Dysgonomonas macrotermitis]SHE48450.1 hypothetical protein SAMN05444362_101431 [Dysgonomonas macrotermitis]